NSRGTRDLAACGGNRRPLLAFARPRGSYCPGAVRPAQCSGCDGGRADLYPPGAGRSHARPGWSAALDCRRAAHGLVVSLATAWAGGRALWPAVWILWRHRRQSRRSALGGVDRIWPSTTWIRRDSDGNWPAGGCGADTGLSLELVASDVRTLDTHRRRHRRTPHRALLGRADVTGIVATPFRSDHRRRNRCTRDLDAR